MTDEEIQREREEAERLIREINATIDRINRVNQENAQLEYELEQSINNVKILIGNCGEMDKAVYEQMGFLSGKVGEADISTKHVFDAINELTTQYFTFKKISTASKNVTQFTDEYHTRFSYYNELRRISLGYVVGLDSHIIGQVEVATVDFAKKFTKKAIEFAELYVHKSELEYTTLRRTCSEYSEMHSLLSTAEKNYLMEQPLDGLRPKCVLSRLH